MIDVFRRVEKKYIITKKQHDELLKEIVQYMRKDFYCINKDYNIFNLYFDSNNYTLCHRSIQKPPFKEKLRMRSYYLNDPQELSFLEVKRKIGKTVSKRRIAGTTQELMNFISTGTIPTSIPAKEKQIAVELSHMIKHYELCPKVFLSYQREAYYDKNNDNFRLTFDSNIQYRTTDLNFSNGNNLTLLPSDKYIMEIKFINSIPLWLVDALSRYKIYPCSFSKYGVAYKDLIKEKQNV